MIKLNAKYKQYNLLLIITCPAFAANIRCPGINAHRGQEIHQIKHGGVLGRPNSSSQAQRSIQFCI